jgi:integrase
MQGIRRAHGVSKDGKSPLLTSHIKAWVKNLRGTNKDLRDKALVLLGFASALRRSELVALDREDIELSPYGLILTIRKSKTDQEGEGAKIGIPYGTGETCPVAALLDWLEAVGIESGSVFRQIRKGNHIQPDRLEDKSVNLIVKDLCESIELESDNYGAHSLRAGHATQARSNGAEEQDCMRQTRHKSISVFRQYVREAELFKRNSEASLGL